jgi:deoxyribodipyrimidine photo-lyase
MASSSSHAIQPSRVRQLNEVTSPAAASAGKYVLYWVQASQRESCNHALEHAIHLANQHKLPLLCCFGLMDNYPEANTRHYAFMLEGLADLHRLLEKRNIKFVLKHGQPPEVALHYAKHAAIVVTDMGYTRHQRAWRAKVAAEARCPVIQVESDAVIPVEVTSNKHEHAARTIRPKIHRQWETYLTPLPRGKVAVSSLDLDVKGDLDPTDPMKLLGKLKLDTSVAPSVHFTGGQTAAQKQLAAFMEHKLSGYDEGRNEPVAAHSSHMSMYLHFGHISPLELALAAREAKAPTADRDAYLEELIVRRELSINFVYYDRNYDRYDCIPDWAKKTLAAHAKDKRPHLYTREQLEAAQTFDPYWNAAQLEMVRTGFMHNYMRMYWGKKILEWSKTPEEAFETTLYLNNKYFLCGRDPNGWANVAWVFGLHDRPWGPERPIFGLVRYMNAAGLERKFDIDAYVKKVALLM